MVSSPREDGGTPYDLAALKAGSPTGPVRWPHAVADVKALNAALFAHQISTIRAVADEETRTVAAIAAMGSQVHLLTHLTAARTVADARARGLDFRFGGPSLAAALWAGRAPDAMQAFAKIESRFEAARRPPPLLPLRKLAFAAKMDGGLYPWRAGAAILNRNRLLEGEARARADRASRLLPPSDFLRGRAPGLDPAFEARLRALADTLADGALALGPAATVRDAPLVADALRDGLVRWLAMVGRHWRQVRDGWLPPKELWTGTGGNYISRLARAATRAAGGRVVGFEHGGGGHIHADATPLHAQEYVFCDRFVVDTAYKAGVLEARRDPAASIDPTGDLPRIEAHRGDRPAHAFRTTGWGGGPVRRVMLVTTAFVGETQYPLQPLMPDAVYADWHRRLIDQLHGLGVEVLVKQHPEGLLRGEPFVLNDKARYIGGRFGEVLGQADAFLFDYPATSTLWEAVLTDRPVVFIDLGLADWIAEIKADFADRCAVVPGRMDDWNRPRVEDADLIAAFAKPVGADRFAERNLVGTRR